MSLAPHQIILGTLEMLMLLVGAWVLARAVTVPELRVAVFGQYRIPHWNISGWEALMLAAAIVVCGGAGQVLAHHLLYPLIRESADHSGLQVVIYGFGFHGTALLGWPIFAALRRHLHHDYGGPPPLAEPSRRLGPRSLIWQSVTALLLALPVVAITSLGWSALLKAAGLPDAPQDLIAIFAAVQSPFVLLAMLVVAVIVAPINEELLFRGVIFRFLRQRLGRAIAYAVSGALFGFMHGNWAGFLPLALLGVALALAYEHSGDIRVPIVVHGLFNLNTTLVLLAGLSTP